MGYRFSLLHGLKPVSAKIIPEYGKQNLTFEPTTRERQIPIVPYLVEKRNSVV
jgi:hypothetical protein